MKALFVSPHPDDVCLSVAGLAAEMTVPKHLLTVFGRSLWAEPGWHGNRSPEAITAARAREDGLYCLSAGFSYGSLGFPDTSVRHMRTGDLRSPDGQEEGLGLLIGQAVGDLVEEEGFGLVVGPLGLGRHADHLVCALAVRDAAAAMRVPCLFYEDVPYALEHSVRGIGRQARRVEKGLRAVVVRCRLPVDEKMRMARIYETQADEAILRGVAEQSRRLDGRRSRTSDVPRVVERVWTRQPAEALSALLAPGSEVASS